MAASSQYHRGAQTPHSHYHALPGNHEHLYADLATSWNSPPAALSRSPAGAVLLQRFSSPAHRPPPAHTGYLDYTGSSADYVNPNPLQPQWPHAYSRSPSQPWSPSFNDQAFPSRSLSYSDPDGRLPVPHDSRPTRQRDNADPTPAQRPPEDHHGHHGHHGLAMNLNLHQQPAPSLTPHQTLAVLPNPTAFPPEAPTLAPLLNYASPDMQPPPQNLSSQAAATWASTSGTHLSPVAPQHTFAHPGPVTSPTINLDTQTPLSNATWAMVSSGPGNPTSVVYEQLPETAQLWPPEPDPPHLGHVHHVLADSTYHGSTSSRVRRAQPKKAAAKVPAAFVARQQKSKVSKRKGPLDEEGRQKTHNMRKLKMSCIRCRFYKSGCDHGDPCQKCQKVSGGARSFKLPCIRDRLEDATLVRHCNGRSNQEEGEFLGYEWLSGWELLGMDFIWNLPGTGPIHIHPMRITIGQYRPKRPLLDSTTNEWNTTEGRLIKVEQPPYAVYDTQSLVPAFERYFTALQPAVEQWIFARISHDEIASLTYQEVVRLRGTRMSGHQNLLDLCMRIQCLSVVSQGYGTVWSNDVPGIQEYDYSQMGRSQYEAYDRNSRDRPLPPAISQQIDVAALKLLKKLETACNKLFAAKIFKPKIKPWYELYLALYVIFWNMEYIHRSAETYILSKNGTTVESHVNNVVSGQLKKWEYSFQVLIHHWQAILRDFQPFKLARENPEELREHGHLDPQGFDYILKVTSIIDRIGGIGQSTAPFIGQRSTHNSLSSEWIKTLLQEAGI